MLTRNELLSLNPDDLRTLTDARGAFFALQKASVGPSLEIGMQAVQPELDSLRARAAAAEDSLKGAQQTACMIPGTLGHRAPANRCAPVRGTR